jgi:transposase IS116/IS110/IS902 family protein
MRVLALPLSVVGPIPAQPIVFQEDVRAVNEHTERLQRLEHELQEQVKAWRLHPVIEALQALRGVQFTVAVTTVAELGDLTRFDHPRELMKFLGLIPSEYSSGERRRQGSMTKASNTHARGALVEGARASRYPATVSRHLQLRLEKQPKIIQDISWKAQVRLCKRFDDSFHEENTPMWSSWPLPVSWGHSCGPLPSRFHEPRKSKGAIATDPSTQQVCQRASEEAQPRCGVTLGGVKRLV